MLFEPQFKIGKITSFNFVLFSMPFTTPPQPFICLYMPCPFLSTSFFPFYRQSDLFFNSVNSSTVSRFSSLSPNYQTTILTRPNSLGPIKTHHALSTQTILFPSPLNSTKSTLPRTANTTTYFTASHFGQGPHVGEVLTAYGKYIDEFICLDAEGGDLEGVEGASGTWRIAKRSLYLDFG
jgi:hypothetical protein